MLKESKLEQILTNSYKEQMISYLKKHPEDFNKTIELAISDKQPYSWRAAWLLWSCMDKNDKRLQGYINKIINVLPNREDNQLRELLMILQRLELNERHEAKLFNICVDTWIKTNKKPSIRYNAFRLMVKITKKYPDLFKEIDLLTQSHYLKSLSGGVQRSIEKLINELTLYNNKGIVNLN